jgi:aspartyl-tRNA synthetase
MRDIKLPHVECVIGYDEPTVLSQDDKKLPHHPELVDLLAKYGNSTSTAWIDPGYKIWRHERTGAAVGYIDSHGRKFHEPKVRRTLISNTFDRPFGLLG